MRFIAFCAALALLPSFTFAAPSVGQYQAWVSKNIEWGTNIDAPYLVSVLGKFEAVTLTDLNPKIYFGYYFPAADVTIFGNKRTNAYIGWHPGRRGNFKPLDAERPKPKRPAPPKPVRQIAAPNPWHPWLMQNVRPGQKWNVWQLMGNLNESEEITVTNGNPADIYGRYYKDANATIFFQRSTRTYVSWRVGKQTDPYGPLRE